MPQIALKRISEGVIDFEMAFEKILKEEMAEIEENQDFSDTSKSDKNLNSNTKTLIKAESETKTQNKILVVDDDPDLRDLITKILISSNYNVEVSEDGLDALIKIAKNNYDLVISDYDMPNLDGLKLIETINKKNLKTKVIMLTASTKEDAEEKALLYGAIDFIKKPFKKDILLLRIRKAMGDK
jgi:CheY-like chemotaxis protein